MLNNQTAVMEAAELLQYMPRSAYHIIKIFPRNEQRKDSTFEGQISCISLASRNRSGHSKDTCRVAFDVGCNARLPTSLVCGRCMLKANESLSTTKNKKRLMDFGLLI
jgi:hypothetical protein